jgi:hypothetical protein
MKLLHLLPFACFAAPAFAGTFAPPAGCEAFLTLQSRSCVVSVHYRCASDAPGDQWRADFGINGMTFRARINYETEWLESHSLTEGYVDYLEPGPRDPANFSELLATGTDTYDFSTMNSFGIRENVRGYDKLIGQTVVIDGIALEAGKVEAEARYDDGTLIWRTRGGQYIHREWRLFFSGSAQWEFGDGQWLPSNGEPVDFILPGEEGFLETTPRYDCDEVIASVHVPVIPASLP